MSKIEDFNKAKDLVRRFKNWAILNGKEYIGGTRGRGGQYGKVVSASCNLEIYHQAYDGATNYHKPDGDFDMFLNKACLYYSSEILKKAGEYADEHLTKVSESARSEAVEVLKALELTTESHQ